MIRLLTILSSVDIQEEKRQGRRRREERRREGKCKVGWREGEGNEEKGKEGKVDRMRDGKRKKT